ncbi:MAG: aldose epimerase family protein [Bacteroidota bacterium]|nr:aldose epimerase family protein [Bacteroidota bacterium]
MKKWFLLLAILPVASLLLPGCSGNGNKSKSEKNDSIKNSTIMKQYFGKVDGQEADLYTLSNPNGITIKITNYGGIITSVIVPDKNGKTGDIVLGYDNLKSYLEKTPYFGALVGRYGNRIANGTFTLDGKIYHLAKNDGNNTLHGGVKGFDKMIWNASEFSGNGERGIILKYLSKDGEEGFPGNLNVTVKYTLNDKNQLIIRMEAVTDKPTPINLCNHSYFNLTGGETDVLNHHVTLYADRYTEVNDQLIPTGKLPLTIHTPMDFSTDHTIGERISQVPGGYDHNYVLTGKTGELHPVAKVTEDKSGRVLTVQSTQPGVQFYTGNFLDGTITGKNGIVYKKHWGFCLETQHFPDSPNQKSFPNSILKPGEKYSETTVIEFSW